LNDKLQRMHPKAVKLSKLTALIIHCILAVAIIVLFVLAFLFEWSIIPIAIAAGVTVLSGVLFIGVVPTVRAQRFAFEVDAEEIRIYKGIWWISDILIPMVKVQHVELESGPLMRRSELAHVTVVTAAGKHRILGLKWENAEAVQRRIALWARVREDDV
jgi:membrane protein YdbS with pleckstrin-like domain